MASWSFFFPQKLFSSVSCPFFQDIVRLLTNAKDIDLSLKTPDKWSIIHEAASYGDRDLGVLTCPRVCPLLFFS